jgi:hypothetical protein
MHTDVERVMAHLKTLGIDVRVGRFDLLLSSPFSLKVGLDYEKKILFFNEGQVDEGVAGLIHEAAHIVACPKAPIDSNEFDFLGWELALAIELGVLHSWIRGMNDYGVIQTTPSIVDGEMFDEVVHIGSMSEDELSELIEERIDYARSIGIVVGDTAIAIR